MFMLAKIKSCYLISYGNRRDHHKSIGYFKSISCPETKLCYSFIGL
uniref:Uncharacterized protein n=1 Tax=Anguilla anguilla TaxID=7936 RepID=A0A0E9R7G7_ANGAN